MPTLPRSFGRIASLLGVAGLTALAACSSAAPSGESVANDDSAVTGAGAVSRAQAWVSAGVQYCQSPYGQTDPDNSCWSQPWESNHRCYRVEDPAWDPYRSDCSGLVSWAWGLPSPGRVTGEFAPFQNDITSAIDGNNLQPGDALNNSDHIILFVSWVHPGSEANFIEEPGCSPAIKHAHEFSSSVSINGTSVYVPYEGMTFTAIRYHGLGSGGGGSSSGGSSSSGGGSGGCVVGGLYCGGDKVSGSASTLYRCTGGTSGTVVESCANGCQVNAGTNDSCRAGGGGSSGGGSSSGGNGSGGCVAGGLYCGGDKVSGNTSTLYRCTSGSSGTEVGACSDGCEVVSGSDDRCRGAGGCVPGGLYCGGDKVSGDPAVLYRCTSGSSGTVDQTCSGGCSVNAGANDSCR